MNAKEVLATVDTILVIDWPSKDVPESLALAGFRVIVRGGPGTKDYSVYQAHDGRVQVRPLGHAPERSDLIYAHRPFVELPQIITTARKLHAKFLWTQSGLSGPGAKDAQGCWVPEDEFQQARALVQSAGLLYLAEPYIADVAREIRA